MGLKQSAQSKNINSKALKTEGDTREGIIVGTMIK